MGWQTWIWDAQWLKDTPNLRAIRANYCSTEQAQWETHSLHPLNDPNTVGNLLAKMCTYSSTADNDLHGWIVQFNWFVACYTFNHMPAHSNEALQRCTDWDYKKHKGCSGRPGPWLNEFQVTRSGVLLGGFFMWSGKCISMALQQRTAWWQPSRLVPTISACSHHLSLLPDCWEYPWGGNEIRWHVTSAIYQWDHPLGSFQTEFIAERFQPRRPHRPSSANKSFVSWRPTWPKRPEQFTLSATWELTSKATL